LSEKPKEAEKAEEENSEKREKGFFQKIKEKVSE